MADMEGQKTKQVGYVSKEKIKHQLGKVWTDYEAAAEAFAKAKNVNAKTKDAVRNAIKKQMKHTGNIDFTDEGERVRIFENLQKTQRARGADLDDMF